LRRRSGTICRNKHAPILNVEEDAERGAEVNHPVTGTKSSVSVKRLWLIGSLPGTASNIFVRSPRAGSTSQG
jgi:hypothetical protein